MWSRVKAARRQLNPVEMRSGGRSGIVLGVSFRRKRGLEPGRFVRWDLTNQECREMHFASTARLETRGVYPCRDLHTATAAVLDLLVHIPWMG